MPNGKLTVGEKVVWTECDIDIPPGTVGTVLGFKADAVRVQFPKGRWVFPASALETAGSEPADKGCLGKVKALPGELKTKLYLGCPLIAMIMVVYTLALYVLDFYSDILLVFEVIPIMSVIYPSAMTVPVFSKSTQVGEHQTPEGSPYAIDMGTASIYFGMAHTGTRRGEELPPLDSMEPLGALPYFSFSTEGYDPEGCNGAATSYPIPNWLQRTANYDLFMTVSSGGSGNSGRLAMYWDRANNYGAKCYGLEYAQEPILMDQDRRNSVGIGKWDGDPMSCPEWGGISVPGNITGRGEPNIRYGNPPYDPTWPNPVLNLDPDFYGINYQHSIFNAEESDFDNTHCANTMTTLPLSDNPDCEVWDPELCMCPTDRSHIFEQDSLDPRHGHQVCIPSTASPAAYECCGMNHPLRYDMPECDGWSCTECKDTLSDNVEFDGTSWAEQRASCKCLGVANSDGAGDDCLDFQRVQTWGAKAWCYTEEGASQMRLPTPEAVAVNVLTH